jgi:hypothetical protein
MLLRTAVRFTPIVAIVWLAACGGGGGGSVPGPSPSIGPSASPRPFLPLAVGDTWTYACYLGPSPGPSTFPKTNTVIGTATVNGIVTYEYQLQSPITPTQSTTQIQLVANDSAGNTILYGYVPTPGASPSPIVSPTVIIAHVPGANGTTYDYPSQNGGTVQRVFCCTENSLPTVFGTFTVDAYFEGSNVLHNAPYGYGYAAGIGSVDEAYNITDPDPNKHIECLITATPPP